MALLKIIIFYSLLQKEKEEENHFTVLHISVLSGLVDTMGLLFPIVRFNLLPPTYTQLEKAEAFKEFLHNCGCFSWLLQQSLPSCSFWKVNCNVKSEFDQYFFCIHMNLNSY